MIDNKRWLIVTDLDGTALKTHTELNPTTVKILKEAKEKGHVVCIATGRPPRNALKFYKELELDTLMANYNGSYIGNPTDRSYMAVNIMLNNELVEELLNKKELMEHVGHWMIEREDEISTNDNEGILFNYFFVKDEVKDIHDGKGKIKCVMDQNSIILQIKDKKNLWKVKEVLDKYDSSIVARPWSLADQKFGMLEINPRRGNKGHALKIMCEYYNIPLNRTIAFGDMPNDLEMIKTAGIGVVMSNGHDDLKDAANIILTKSNKENGIEEFLRDNLKI